MSWREVTPRPPATSNSGRLGRPNVDVMPSPTTSRQTTPQPAPLAVGQPELTAAVVEAPAPPVLLTASEVAELLRVDPYTVRKWIGRGDLGAYRVGRELRIDPAAVRVFLDARRSA